MVPVGLVLPSPLSLAVELLHLHLLRVLWGVRLGDFGEGRGNLFGRILANLIRKLKGAIKGVTLSANVSKFAEVCFCRFLDGRQAFQNR